MNMNWSELRAIRTNRWKYVRAPHAELYDLVSDPSETKNVIQQQGPEVQKFEAHLKNLISPAGDGTRKSIRRCSTRESWISFGHSATWLVVEAVPTS